MLEQYGKVLAAIFGIIVVIVIVGAIAVSVKQKSVDRVNGMDTQYNNMMKDYTTP